MKKITIFCVAITVQTGVAQRIPTGPHDVEAGNSRYMNICASCHGQDGDQVAGVDLGHGKFRRANNDRDLVNIIRNGIPGTGMPANKMPEDAASAVVAYLHSMAADNARNTSAAGDPARGAALFQGKGDCMSCHRIGTNGSRLGPDLTEIGRLRRSAELERSIVDPDAEIAPQNRFARVVTQDGTTVTGRLLNHDAFTVLLMDNKEQLRAFDRTTLREFTIDDKHSTMPSYRGRLSDREISDLVSYLAKQKGTNLQ